MNQSAGWQGSRNALRPFFVLWFSMLVMQCILAGDGVRAVLAAGLHSKGRAAFCPLLCAGARAKFPALISGHSDGLRGLRRERFCAGRRVASESRRTFFGDSWILEKNIGRSKLLSGRRHTSLEMVLSDEKGRRKRDQYPSLPFDFETAAMPEHLDQIMSPPVMFARLKEVSIAFTVSGLVCESVLARCSQLDFAS